LILLFTEFSPWRMETPVSFGEGFVLEEEYAEGVSLPGNDSAGKGFPPSGELSPYVVYLSANGLFLMMALFLLIDPLTYRGYLPLYGAGKVLSIGAFYVWGIFALFRAGDALSGASPFFGAEALFPYPGGWFRLGSGFFVSLGDLLSVLGCRVLSLEAREEPRERDIEEVVPAEEEA